jgi:predicted transcriptional regulator
MVSDEITTRRKPRAPDSTLRTMSFKTRPDMQRAVRICAAEQDLDVSEIIRRALAQYLERV